MSEFKCYQTNQTTNVVVDGEGHARERVVTISREVGNERARSLMRLCAAVLNENMVVEQLLVELVHPRSLRGVEVGGPQGPRQRSSNERSDREEHKMQATYNVNALEAKLEELIAEEEARRNEKAEWIRDEIAERLQRAIEEKQDVTARTVANDVEEAADEKFARKAGRIGTMRKGVEKLSLVDGDTVTLNDTDLYNLGLEHH